jgi:hypothetical protein
MNVLVLEAYRAAGFVVKQSKVVMPTCSPVKVIGFDIDGRAATISLPSDSQLSLIKSTLSVLRMRTVSGSTLSHVIGRWTWLMMLCRPSLAILQHVYRYCQVAQHRQFTLWNSVRKELSGLLAIMPLLHARLDAHFFHRAIASDASQLGGGVVSTPLTPNLHSSLWPLCSNRHHAILQSQLNAAARRLLISPHDKVTRIIDADELVASSAPYLHFYSCVASSPWRTLISTPWSGAEHINTLELRAALLAVHWVLSYSSSLCSRVFILLDSTVAFFSMWKGRSSSPKLLLVLRKLSALSLAGGLSVLPGWIPSAVNPADAPSRLVSL